MQIIEHHTPRTRFLEPAKDLSALCDTDFAMQDEELERQFAYLRLQLASFE